MALLSTGAVSAAVMLKFAMDGKYLEAMALPVIGLVTSCLGFMGNHEPASHVGFIIIRSSVLALPGAVFGSVVYRWGGETTVVKTTAIAMAAFLMYKTFRYVPW